MPKVILKFEAAVIKEHPMITSTLTIGRKPDNDLVINHPAVSGSHCRIILHGDTYFVEDLNSTNGTLVNDKKIIKSGIHNNDVITVAKHTITFIDDRPQSAAATAKPEEVAVPTQAPPPPPPPKPAQIGNPNETMQDLQLASGISLNKGKFDRIGGLLVIDGGMETQTDYVLKDTSIYLGKSDRAGIKVKGGMMAPDLGALISRKPDGYVLVALKEGYPKVNGMSVDKERKLNEGDIVEVGGTKLQFYLKAP